MTRDAAIEEIWRRVKTNGYGPRERAGHVLDALTDMGLIQLALSEQSDSLPRRNVNQPQQPERG